MLFIHTWSKLILSTLPNCCRFWLNHNQHVGGTRVSSTSTEPNRKTWGLSPSNSVKRFYNDYKSQRHNYALLRLERAEPSTSIASVLAAFVAQIGVDRST
ncbi:Uncharacterized protein HZ326_24710 [Fusarium oxysporum f. sp. albedinis]|nr:Uncharacterized protein HZ326_24710 [Fusarium oxysporum f. sp. albedinis]